MSHRELPDAPPAVKPLLLVPQLKRRIWGGTSLEAIDDAEVESGEDPVGEAWLAHDQSPIRSASGRTASTLGEHVQKNPTGWLGPSSSATDGPVVPILLKILDAADDLSVQVHPADAQVTPEQRKAGHRGKTESWVVLAAESGAFVLWGTRGPLGVAEAVAASDRGELSQHLNRIPVRAGSVVHNPAGTVHAVGRGLRLFELQQASDITYRLDDYGRRDAAGRLRELHIDQGLKVSDLSGKGNPQPHVPANVPAGTVAVCEHYLLRDIQINGEQQISFHNAAIRFVTVIEGELRFVFPDDEEPIGSLAYPSTVAVPAVTAGVTVHGRGRIMVSEASG